MTRYVARSPRTAFVDAVFGRVLDSRKFLEDLELPDSWVLLEVPPGGGGFLIGLGGVSDRL